MSSACQDLGGLAGGGSSGTPDGGKVKGDGGSLDGSVEDGGVTPSAARCTRDKPFGAPELVTQFDPTADFVKDAIQSKDQLEVFYLRYAGNGNWDLRHGRRAKVGDAWSAPVSEAITPTPDGTITLTAGDLKLYFWTIDSDYRVSRPSTGDAFGVPVKYDVTSAPAAFFVQSDDTAYFSEYAEGGADRFIKRATVNSSGFSLTSTTVPNIHVAKAYDSRPVLNTSETAMYFASNRPGGKGLDDIWVARRASKQVEFDQPLIVLELSTDEPDAVTWVSDDECEVYLNRASHVYTARRPL